MNDAVLVSRYRQAIHDSPYSQVAELLVPVHGRRKQDGPATGSGPGIDDQTHKTRIACWIAKAKNLAVPAGQQCISVASSLLDFVNLVSEVTDYRWVELLCRAPRPKALRA